MIGAAAAIPANAPKSNSRGRRCVTVAVAGDDPCEAEMEVSPFRQYSKSSIASACSSYSLAR